MADETTAPAAGEAVTPAPATAPATETPPAPQTETHETTGEPAAAQQGNEDERERKPNRIDAKERVQQAVRRQRLAERERDAALRRIAELEKPIRPQNFDSLDYESRDQLRVREAVRQETAESVRQEALRAEDERRDAWAEARDARNEAFIERLSTAEATSPGLFERFAQIPVTEEMAEFIGGSHKGVEIAKHLSAPENRAETELLIRLTDPRSATRADLREADRILSRIEQRVVSAPAVRKATTAPNPGTTLTGGSAAPRGLDPATASDAEWSQNYRDRRKRAAENGR